MLECICIHWCTQREYTLDIFNISLTLRHKKGEEGERRGGKGRTVEGVPVIVCL